jgi:hypothetical protein
MNTVSITKENGFKITDDNGSQFILRDPYMGYIDRFGNTISLEEAISGVKEIINGLVCERITFKSIMDILEK